MSCREVFILWALSELRCVKPRHLRKNPQATITFICSNLFLLSDSLNLAHFHSLRLYVLYNESGHPKFHVWEMAATLQPQLLQGKRQSQAPGWGRSRFIKSNCKAARVAFDLWLLTPGRNRPTNSFLCLECDLDHVSPESSLMQEQEIIILSLGNQKLREPELLKTS